MSRKSRTPSDEDLLLWDHVTRDIAPLPNPKPAPAKTDTAVKKPKAPPKTPARVKGIKDVKAAAPVAPVTVLGKGIDKNTQKRLEKGQKTIDYTLDLHGKTQNEALDALRNVLLRAYQGNLRCVLVITGKGTGGKGVIRANFHDWLAMAPLNAIILHTSKAQPKHGGDGAFYVLLRRKRDI